jgi:predicted transcriptional regulator
MDIQLEKLELIKMLVETDDQSIIESVKKIFSSNKKDFWEELSQEQRDEIEESDRQIDRGEFVLFEDVMKKYRS